MKVPALMILVVVGLAFIASAYSETFIEAQDASMEEGPAETNVKRYHWRCTTRRCYYHNQCPQGQYCYYQCCRPRPCSHHAHCPQGWYCDYTARSCKVGERRCSTHYHCYNEICVNGKCRKRECYYHNQCKQGYQCYYGICKAICTSQSSCTASQCCAKYYPQQVGGRGLCSDLKKSGEWCLLKPYGYQCGCTNGYECRRYQQNYYWGKCTLKPTTKPTTRPTTQPVCSSDNNCQKTHCCSDHKCKPRRKANGYCPLKGADKFFCGCIEGYQCKQANVGGNYWGKCVVAPTEEPGSGLGEMVS